MAEAEITVNVEGVQDVINLKAAFDEAMACLTQIAECGCEDPGPEVEGGFRCSTRTKVGMDGLCNPCLAKHTLANIEGMPNPKGK